MSWFSKVLAEVGRIAEYNEEAERAYRRLRGGNSVDNRFNAADRFHDERQYEAMRAVERARLQREAARVDRATWEGTDRQGLLGRLGTAFRRVIEREPAGGVPAVVRIRRQ